MVTATVLAMGKRRGGSAKKPGSGTEPVKLSNDLMDMIREIVRVKKSTDPGYTAAKLIEPMIRPQLTARYEQIKGNLERIKQQQEEAAEKLDDV